MPDFFADGFDEARLQRFVEETSIEVAIVADGDAEGNVDV